MSLRGAKSSAFAVFKGSKATSLTNVTNTPKENSKSKKSNSTNTTPTNMKPNKYGSITSLVGKFSEKKKQKSEAKKMKKLLKSSKRERASYLPDSAIQSPLPLVGNLSNGGIKDLRPKQQNSDLVYNLPLKATPEVTRGPRGKDQTDGSRSVIRKDSKNQPTPPLPPRAGRKSASSVEAITNTNTESSLKRKGRAYSDTLSPNSQKKISVSHGKEVLPPKPAKRRRLSQGSAPPSPQSSSSSTSHKTMFSPEGAWERREPMPAHPISKDGQPYMFDSQIEAKKLFECMIHPVKPQKFFAELWEKKPLLVKRHMPKYNEGWFSTEELDQILRKECIQYGVNLDVVTYTDGKRETHNPAGRAHAPVVWDYFQNGCSVRMLNPQTYSRSVWKLLSILQEYFNCCVGANIYLTPPGTQGFAPHYDDIEAFILQLEGKKHWRLYSPITESETLPRFSSNNFTDKDIGEPILDVILEAGDLLYFPRGLIHQGKTLDDAHSLHITVSCYQKNTWGDLLERLVPQALQSAINEDIEFRKALPKDYLNYMGVAFSDIENPDRKMFIRKIEQLMTKIASYAPVDGACDQMGKQFVHDSLPPLLSEQEKKCSIHGNGERWSAKQGRVIAATELDPDTRVKIIRKGAIRMVLEGNDDIISIYHNLENARVHHGKEVQWFELSADYGPAVEYLIKNYPNYVSVDSIPGESEQERMEVVNTLYEKGLLVTDQPLEPLSGSESSDQEEEEEQANKHKKKVGFAMD